LAEAGVVVDHKHDRDASAPSGFEFGEVIIQRAVA
jgi:hypothetical protein